MEGLHILLIKIMGIYVVAMLSLSALWDIKKREVNPLFWYLTSKLALPIGIWELFYLYKDYGKGITEYILTLNLIMIIIYTIFYIIGLLGGADVGALVFSFISTPYIIFKKIFLPTAFISGFFGSLFQLVFYALYLCILNLRSPIGYRDLRCFIRIRVRVEYLLNRKWWFISKARTLSGFSIEEWPHYRIAEAAYSKGLDGVVEASPGIPHIPFYLIGYILSILLMAI